MKKLIIYIKGILHILLIMILYYGCNDDSVNGVESLASVEGVLTLPADAEGKTYAVIIDEDIDGDNGFKFSTSGVCTAGTSQSYLIEDVEAGSYYLYAAVFVVENFQEEPGVGDFIGIYGGTLDNRPTEPNVVVPAGGKVTCNVTLYPIHPEITTGKWIAVTDFGGFDFIVSDDGSHIIEITYEFSDWTCGSSTIGGSVTVSSSPGWSIEDMMFTIDNIIDPASGNRMILNGEFGSDGLTATGSWEAQIGGATCGGSWNATPE